MSDAVRSQFLARKGPFAAFNNALDETGWYRRVNYTSCLIVLDGEGRMRTRGPAMNRTHLEHLEPGRMFLVSPTDITEIDGGASISWVGFPTQDWQTFTAIAGLDAERGPAGRPPTATVDPASSRAARSFDHMIRRYGDDPTRIDLIEFWACIGPAFFPRRERMAPAIPSWLSTSVHEMHEEENLRVGVSRFAELAHVSRAHLAVATRRFYQQTPIGMLAELRLQRAAFLLRTSADPVNSIARRCGFTTLAYFSNRFREMYGVSPRRYRADVRASWPDPEL